jgi:hypothetical protein
MMMKLFKIISMSQERKLKFNNNNEKFENQEEKNNKFFFN